MFSSLDHYKKLARNLEKSEEALHASLNPDVEAIVKTKKVLLFRRMLADIQYDDQPVADLLVSGVRLSGDLKPTGIWKAADKAATVSVKDLWMSAKAAQAAVLAPLRGKSEEDAKIRKELWEATVEEKIAGTLLGPFTAEQIVSAVGPLWIAARRFPVVQNGKLRPIDDFSEFGQNQTFGAQEKVDLRGLDQVVAWAREWQFSVGSDRSVNILLDDGEVLSGTLAAELEDLDARQLVGRVLDLKGAYKQLAAHPADKGLSIVAVYDPESRRTVLS